MIAIRSRRTVLATGPAGEIAPATVYVEEGRILAVERDPNRTVRVDVDLGDTVLMPGVVDAHVHINEPGRTSWEGFETAGRAAVAGGVTTLVDMPLNSTPVTTNPQAVARKVARIRKCRADVGLWGGLVPSNAECLGPLLDAGVLGLKCFLVDSGLADFPAVEAGTLWRAMPQLAARDLPLLAHCEAPDVIASSAGRPPQAEAESIRRLVTVAEATGCRIHVVHVASADAVAVVRAARRRGVRITAETCPHYLAFDAESIPDGGTDWKCAPPIRDRSHADALWHALVTGDLDDVQSDHSPCPPAMKDPWRRDLRRAWGGVASLEVLLPALWTFVRRRRATNAGLMMLAEWLCRSPAARIGLGTRKGRIAPGYDADLVAFDPDARFTVRAAELHHRHAQTAWAGQVLRGVVKTTWLRGTPVFQRAGSGARFTARFTSPTGRWLPHPRARPCVEDRAVGIVAES